MMYRVSHCNFLYSNFDIIWSIYYFFTFTLVLLIGGLFWLRQFCSLLAVHDFKMTNLCGLFINILKRNDDDSTNFFWVGLIWLMFINYKYGTWRHHNITKIWIWRCVIFNNFFQNLKDLAKVFNRWDNFWLVKIRK